jgi:hypothetical protein
MNIALLLVAAGPCARAQESSLPSASAVVEQMLARDANRQHAQEGYAGMRRYVLVNNRLNKRAEMVVRVNGDPDGTKHFEVLGEEGWKAAQKHVLHKMLESEAETSRPEVRVATRLSSDNYDFEMVGTEKDGERTLYVIDITPKRKDKYLVRGRIWVDAADYALARVDGSPAKNPSFWTKKVHVVQTYQKCGEFWFPITTESVTDAFLFGKTDLTIQYFDYKPNAVVNVAGGAPAVAQKGMQR